MPDPCLTCRGLSAVLADSGNPKSERPADVDDLATTPVTVVRPPRQEG